MDWKIKTLCQKMFLLILCLLKKKNQSIICMTLYSFNGPFQAPQVDIAYISFWARSAVDPKFCLLFVNKFYFKNVCIPHEKKFLQQKKKELFYNDLKKKRLGKMRLLMDQEFKQRNIEELNKKFNVEMHSTHLRGGKSFCSRTKNLWTKKTFIKK